jgi:hypothetical protein
MPTNLSTVLSRPVFGEARIDHATAATSGGTNNGIMLTAEMKPLHGVSVRTTTQENVSPMTTASAVPPPQAISELASARWTLGLPRTVMKLASEMSKTPKPSTTGLVLVSAPSSSIETG